MGWNSQVVIAQQVFIEGTADGLFIYNGAPGLGNLIGSWTAAPGTDPYGNAFIAGITATQGVLNGIRINVADIVNPLIENGTLTGPNIQSAAISSGTITESVITFDSSGGSLFAYITTTTSVTQTVNGNYTFTAPAGVTQARVQCWGAGAGGDGGTSATGGNGGGGGEYAEEPAYPLVPGNVYAYIVGDGGASAVTGSGHGGDGGDTSFDNVQVYAHGGKGNRTGGTGSVNTIHFNGGTGGDSVAGDTGAAGGGGSAGATGAGGNGTTATGATGQAGGAAGAGGGAAGGAGGNNAANGVAGSAPGAGGGGAGSGNATNTFDKTYTCTASHSYQGSDGTNPNQKINDNGTSYQGGDVTNTYNGKAKSWFLMPSAIAGDLVGVNVTATKVTLNNNHSWYNSGMTVALGTDTTTTFGATKGDPTQNPDLIEFHVDEGATITKDVTGHGFATAFQTNGARCLVVFKNSNNLNYYGYFAGASQSGPPKIRFIGTTGTGTTSSGAGADGKVVITYTSGTTLVISVSPVAGTDVFGHAFPAGIMVHPVSAPIVAIDPVNGGAETWHTLGTLAITNLQLVTGRFRMLPTGDVMVEFSFAINASTSVASTFAAFSVTLPAAYQPTTARAVGIGSSGTTWTISSGRLPSMEVTSSGAVQISFPAITTAGSGISGGANLIYSTT